MHCSLLFCLISCTIKEPISATLATAMVIQCRWRWCKRNGNLSYVRPGWVSITTCAENLVTLKAFTPGGLGCVLRSPALLKYAVNLRGKRIRGTYKYHTRPPKFCGEKWNGNLRSAVSAVWRFGDGWCACDRAAASEQRNDVIYAMHHRVWSRLTSLNFSD